MTDPITAHQYAQQLRERMEREILQPLIKQVYGVYEPHCIITWREQVAGADDTIDYRPKEAQ